MDEVTRELAQHLASGATQAIGTVKKQLLVSFDNSPEAQMALEGKAISHLASCKDGQEGIQAFLINAARFLWVNNSFWDFYVCTFS
jgi:enoyl-CoA hydratase/carnithine racemase